MISFNRTKQFFKYFFLFIFFNISILFSNINRDTGGLISSDLLDTMEAEYIYNYLIQYLPSPPLGYDVSIYSITYETLNINGDNTIASGAIAIPHLDGLSSPLISFQHGTTLEKDQVASVYGFDLVSLWLGTTGYVTVLPDYIGLGVSDEFHPYMIADLNASSIIDMLRATKEFCQLNDFNLNSQLFLVGYSEGGYTTMATHKMIEEQYSNEFIVTASAPCAGPYDLSGVMADLMTSFTEYGQPYYLPYTVLAYQDAYNLVDDLNEYFLPFYADTLPVLFDGYHSVDQVNQVMPSIPIEIFKPEVIDEFVNDLNHPLREALQINDLLDWAPQGPMKILHSDSDELVPLENSQNAYINFVLNGAMNVEFLHGEWGTHQDAAPLILLAAASWFNDLMHFGILGDLNEDNNINIQDVIMLTNIVLDMTDISNYQNWAGDYNLDQTIDIYDIILIINYIISI